MVFKYPAATFILALLQCIRGGITAPTWPSSVDELEDIMLLNTGYRARGFSTTVTPCGTGAAPGRVAAAEFIRTAFHDMATGNVYLGTGGLDASLIFELGGDNPGPGFPTTLTTFAPYLSSRSSMADLIAMGMYTAVRACGGPVIPVKTGRVDATEAGPPGVPQPQNSLYTFQNQFLRTGFDTTQMIQVVACGHTLGGVHSNNFPQIVPAGSSPNDFKSFDSTQKFDEKIASEYVAGKTTDPLVVGPSQNAGRASDLRVFTADGNATITTMANPATFASTCQTLLQKMIEVVPSGVALTDPITPYDIKPVALQLTLQAGGAETQFSGEIRVRTTSRPASQILSVQLVYKDRTGAAASTKISTTSKGSAAGFDDTFAFYAFSTKLPSQTSISAFDVVVTLASGATETYNNNGNGFPMQDTVIFQAPQSCIAGTKITITAAVRSPASSADLVLSLKVPRSVITPELQSQTVALTKQSTVGPYDILSGTYTLASTQAQNTRFDVTSGQASDSFKSTGDLGTTCTPLGSGGSSSSSTSTSSSSSSSSPSSSSTSRSSTSTTLATTTKPTTTTTSAPPNSTPTLAGYAYQGCYTDSTSARVLTGRSTSSSTMTYQSCSTYCAGYTYFGTEYGSQCYCGNAFSNPTTSAPATDCSFKCSGDATQTCGAGNRLTLFKSTAQGPTNPAVAGWTYDGCYTDSGSARVLTGKYVPDSSLTIEKCAAACKGYGIFGAEYGSQCYCGNVFSNPSTKVAEGDCGYTCAGNAAQLCGAGNRLNVYRVSA